jgi:hypothetical protein
MQIRFIGQDERAVQIRSHLMRGAINTRAIGSAILPLLEQLEQRRLWDATIQNGVLNITGTGGADVVVIARSAPTNIPESDLNVIINGQA